MQSPANPHASNGKGNAVSMNMSEFLHKLCTKNTVPKDEPRPVFEPVEGQSFTAMIDPFEENFAVLTMDRQPIRNGDTIEGDVILANLGLPIRGFEYKVADVIVPADLRDHVLCMILSDFIAQMTVVDGRIVMDGEVVSVEGPGKPILKLMKANGEVVDLSV